MDDKSKGVLSDNVDLDKGSIGKVQQDFIPGQDTAGPSLEGYGKPGKILNAEGNSRETAESSGFGADEAGGMKEEASSGSRADAQAEERNTDGASNNSESQNLKAEPGDGQESRERDKDASLDYGAGNCGQNGGMPLSNGEGNREENAGMLSGYGQGGYGENGGMLSGYGQGGHRENGGMLTGYGQGGHGENGGMPTGYGQGGHGENGGMPSGYGQGGHRENRGMPSGYGQGSSGENGGMPSGCGQGGRGEGGGMLSGYGQAGCGERTGMPSSFREGAYGQNGGRMPYYVQENRRQDRGMPPGYGQGQNMAPQYGYGGRGRKPDGAAGRMPGSGGPEYYYGRNSYQYPEQGGYEQELEAPLTVGEWLVNMLLMLIPCVNIILMLVWAFGDKEKKSKSNYYKARLIFCGILIGILFLWTCFYGMAALFLG